MMFSVLKTCNKTHWKKCLENSKSEGGVRGFWKKLIFKQHFLCGKLPLGFEYLINRTGLLKLKLIYPFPPIYPSAHLGNPCRERRSYFAVYFTAGFNNKTVPCTMNELYLTGATREAACAHCTMRKYSRKRITQKPRPSEAWFFYKKCRSLIDLQLL